MNMDRWSPAGFYNFFGSFTFRIDVGPSLALASIFREEIFSIQGAQGLQVYIVFNPVTVQSISKMSKRGGNALAMKPEDGPLISKFPGFCPSFRLTTPLVLNINLHWSDNSDEPRMRTFMRRMIARMADAAQARGTHHAYRFQNHAFEEQEIFAGYSVENLGRLRRVCQAVDPDGVFQRLQPGFFKLESTLEESTMDVKSEL